MGVQTLRRANRVISLIIRSLACFFQHEATKHLYQIVTAVSYRYSGNSYCIGLSPPSTGIARLKHPIRLGGTVYAIIAITGHDVMGEGYLANTEYRFLRSQDYQPRCLGIW